MKGSFLSVDISSHEIVSFAGDEQQCSQGSGESAKRNKIGFKVLWLVFDLPVDDNDSVSVKKSVIVLVEVSAIGQFEVPVFVIYYVLYFLISYLSNNVQPCHCSST